MAKSTRSKSKRFFRAKKRSDGVYAAAEAARLNRLHSKLKALTTKDDDVEVEDVSNFGDEESEAQPQTEQSQLESSGDGAESMDIDSGAGPSTTTDSSKSISTHGPRTSRRDQWRAAKGLPPRKSKRMNRQGGIAAKRKAGHSHRRR